MRKKMIYGVILSVFVISFSSWAVAANTTPAMTVVGGTNFTVTAGVPFALSVRGTDADGDSLTYSIISALPAWLSSGSSNPLTTVSGTLGILGSPAGGLISPGASDGGADGSLALNAKHRYANFLAFDNNGVLYISDNEQNVVRRIDEATGKIHTVAGQLGVYTGGAATTFCSFTNGAGLGATAAEITRYNEGGLATAATLCEVNAIGFDSNNNLILSDYGSLTIRKVDQATGIITTIMGALNAGTPIVIGPTAATTSKVHQAWDFAIDKNTNNIYIADTSSNVIRKYDNVAKTLTVIAGLPQGHVIAHPVPLIEPGLSARLNAPQGVVLNSAGTKLYFTERFHHLIRVLDTATNIVTVIAGDKTIPAEGAGGTGAFTGDGGLATAARFNEPEGLILSPDEKNLFVTDAKNQRIRKINFASGIITTIAGTGLAGTGNDGGTALTVDLSSPHGMAFSPKGDLYFGDAVNNAFRKITNGIVLTGTPTALDLGGVTITVRVSDGITSSDQAFTINGGTPAVAGPTGATGSSGCTISSQTQTIDPTMVLLLLFSLIWLLYQRRFEPIRSKQGQQ